MTRIWGRRRKVEELVLKHLKCVREAINLFVEATYACLRDCNREKGTTLALATHQAEGHADEVRRQVVAQLIEGTLLPVSRRQVLEIIGRVDTLANAAEASLDYLLNQEVDLPEDATPDLLKILKETASVFDDVECAIRSFFSRRRGEVLECVCQIDEGEARIDELERKLVRRVFRANIELAKKLHLQGYVNTLVEIADRAEDLSDRIALLVAEHAF